MDETSIDANGTTGISGDNEWNRSLLVSRKWEPPGRLQCQCAVFAGEAGGAGAAADAGCVQRLGGREERANPRPAFQADAAPRVPLSARPHPVQEEGRTRTPRREGLLHLQKLN